MINNKINLTFKILDDQPKFYVEKINIFGNNITIEEVIRNEFIVDEGDPFNDILFNKSINNIKSTKVFLKMLIQNLDGSDDNSLKNY